MRSTAVFRRLEQFHLEPELDVGRAVQRPDAARPLFEKRTEPAGATPTEVSFGSFRLLRTQFLLLEGDEPVPLGSRALEILIALLERHGELVSKQDLIANPTSLKVTTRRPLTVTEVAFSILVNDHERPSPDGATQGSSA